MAQGRPDPSRGVGTPQTTGPPFNCADSYCEERPQLHGNTQGLETSHLAVIKSILCV